MKKTLIVLALVAMTSMSSVAFASDRDDNKGSVANATANAAALAANYTSVKNTNTNLQGQVQGQLQGQAIVGSGNSSIATGAVNNTNLISTKGTVGNVGSTQTQTNGSSSSTSGNTNTSTGNAVSVSTVDPNSVKVAEINAKATVDAATAQANTGTRDLTDQAIAAGHDQAARDVANTMKPINNTPAIVMGQLTTSNDTCMGSAQVGGSGPGFSIGVGTTYTDKNCVMLKNSRELWNRGYQAASMALLCKDADNKEALEVTGYVCPVKVSASPAAKPTVVQEAGQ